MQDMNTLVEMRGFMHHKSSLDPRMSLFVFASVSENLEYIRIMKCEVWAKNLFRFE